MYTVEPLDEESSFPCNCCGRPIYEGAGWLFKGESDLACYQYRWSEGHEAAFSMAVAGTSGEHMRPGFVTISARQDGDQVRFSVLEPGQSAWDDSDDFGPVLTRDESLSPTGAYPDLWELVDAITETEPRLASRLAALDGP